jgi:hypothetical protein
MIDRIMNDLKNYLHYHYLSIFIVISIFFGLSMGITHVVPPMIYVYISVFILPVISFSVGLVIGQQQNDCRLETPHTYALSKIISANIIQLIPLVVYLIVMLVVLNLDFNVLYFILIYLVSSMLHIMIGLSLSIIAKTQFSLSLSYLVYLIVFSLIPIFYSMGMIQSEFLSYFLIISPAYLAGVMFEGVMDSFYIVQEWFVYVAFLIQTMYILILYFFVIKPFISLYLRNQKKQFE